MHMRAFLRLSVIINECTTLAWARVPVSVPCDARINIALKSSDCQKPGNAP